jgi:hypothetical protein
MVTLQRFRAYFRQYRLWWIGLTIFALTVLLVNPVRETAMEDDWAYALIVKHLLETGHYQLHDWGSANLPFQAYWGALFASIGGYSHSSLRISTLTLTLLGLIAFYHLAREHSLNLTQSGLLTLGMFASPLILRFSFNFMTDVPFLSCLIIAIFLYTRAIRLYNYPLMLLASIAASAAILTRQFGVALVAGVFCLWALNRECRQHTRFFLSGMVLPILAGVWQLYAGLLTPNLGAQFNKHIQSIYLGNAGNLVTNVLWRPTVILQYLALFCIPFIGLALLDLTFELKQDLSNPLKRKFFKPKVVRLGILSVYILSGIIYGRFVFRYPWLMPYLPWNFQSFSNTYGLRGLVIRGTLTLLTSLGAVLLARIFILRYFGSQGWRRELPSQQILDLVTLFLLIGIILYSGLGDEYLIVLLPFTLIVLGRHLKNWLNRFSRATAIACMIILLVSALWTRSLLASSEAFWQGGEYLRSRGIQTNQIYTSWTWVCYYRFQDYVAEIGEQKLVSSLTTDLFAQWLPEQQKKSPFWVTDSLNKPADEKWQVLKEIPYRDIRFREQRVYVVKKERESK